MNKARLLAVASAAAMALTLSACGGGGVNSTPTPTPTPGTPTPTPGTPTPTPTGGSYSTLAQLVEQPSDHTFQTGGAVFDTDRASAPATTKRDTFAFGNGVKLEYIALLGTEGTYRMTAQNGDTSDFPIVFGEQLDSQAVGYKDNNYSTLTLIVPKVAGVNLSYTMFGTWNYSPQMRSYLAVGGVPTRPGDMPKAGSASYNLQFSGSALANGKVHALNADSTAAFAANFANGTVEYSMNLAGREANASTLVSFGSVSGSGSIASQNSGFLGNLTGANGSGAFSGAFFGPAASEMGLSWYVKGETFEARGLTAGRKN